MDKTTQLANGIRGSPNFSGPPAHWQAPGYQPRWEEGVSPHMVMTHMLQEYGRRNGHADFLRKGIDGTVGA
ncbi:hypothetical protein GCM10010430_76300 [Kitasatospora cystarginea]|uniref:DUF664 domain-containing protein n=1 Tax=Kitasatospora cystarginea TaxID=58350 RepID=A0ABN3EZM0_9ACTN